MPKEDDFSLESKTRLAAEAFRRSRMRIKEARKSDVLWILGIYLRGEFNKEELFRLLEYYSSRPRAAGLVNQSERAEEKVEEEFQKDFLRATEDKF